MEECGKYCVNGRQLFYRLSLPPPVVSATLLGQYGTQKYKIQNTKKNTKFEIIIRESIKYCFYLQIWECKLQITKKLNTVSYPVQFNIKYGKISSLSFDKILSFDG